MRRSWKAGAAFHLLMFIFCISLVALGTSYKAFLRSHSYNNGYDTKDASKIMHEIEESLENAATMYSISLSVVLFTLDAMHACHTGLKDYCSFSKTKVGMTVFVFRNATCIFALTLVFWITDTEVLALIGMMLLFVEVIATVIFDYYLHLENTDEFDDKLLHWSDNFAIVVDSMH